MENPSRSPRIIRFGVFEADLNSGELRKNGAKIKLQEQPFQLLILLLARPGEVVTREQLRKRLWPDDTFVDFDRSLNTAVSRIREALGDSAENPRFIETLPRRGYRFIGPVESGTDPTNTTQRDTPAQATVRKAHRPAPIQSRLPRAGLVGAAVLVFALAAWQLSDREPTAAPRFPIGDVSIAVLPLDDLSPGGDQEYFSDGMTDALISNLGGISGLRVISRTSVMKYKNARRSTPEVAQELGVTHVVDGSILRAGDKVRITVQLIDAPADRQLWSKSYERELAEVLVLQREVARAVANGVRVKLTGPEEAQLTSTETVSAAAFEAYLRGREASHVEAVKYFEAAIEEVPDFALAHAWLAHAYLALGLDSTDKSPGELVPKAKVAVERALELDGALADAHRCVGDIKLNYDWDWPGAESAYQEAIRLNPSDAMTRVSYAFLFMITGRREEGFQQIREAQKLAPHWLRVKFFAALHHQMATDYDQAIEQFRAILSRDSDLWLARVHLAENYALKGLYGLALDHLVKAGARSGDDLRALANSGWVYGLRGDSSRATAVAHELETLSRQRYVPPYLLAKVYMGLNENAKALDWLEVAVSKRDVLLANLMVDPTFEPLRSEPRFNVLLEELGFTAS